MPVVYIDVVWLVNLALDALILATTVWIAKRPIRKRRIAIGALVGATYALSMFYPPLAMLTSWPGKLLVSIFMVWLVTPNRNWRTLLQMTMLFYFVSFMYAGSAMALRFVLPGVSVASGMVANGRLAFVTNITSLTLVVSVPVAFWLLQYAVRTAKRLRVRSNHILQVRAALDDQLIEFTGLVDTGNQLRDPVSGKPVCMVNYDTLVNLLPIEARISFQTFHSPIEAMHHIQNPDLLRRFTLIPYRGIAGIDQLSVAIRPDWLEVMHASSPKRMSTVLLGFRPGKLSADGRFEAILHTEVIMGDDGLEHTMDTAESKSQIADANPTGMDSHSRQHQGEL